MPLYEYRCQQCGFEFETILKFSDPPITVCPQCGEEKVIKKISLTAFQLKGEGWYKDGYARPSEAPKKEDSKSTTSTEKTAPKESPDAKKETKNETKKDTKKETKVEPPKP